MSFTKLSALSRRALLGTAAAALVATSGLLPSGSASAADVTIPIIVKDTTSFYWQIVLAGARAAGKDLGVTVPELGAQAETDINGQVSILENAVSGSPAAIVIAPTEKDALGAPITEAAASVPIIGIDSSASSDKFSSFLTTDNVQGGRIAADGLAAAIAAKHGGKAEGDVALITNAPGAGSLEQRKEGFVAQLKEKYPGLNLVADKYADGQASTGLNITTDLLTANPNLVGIFASNLIMAQGAGQAVAENKAQDKVALVGFDSDDKLVSFLKEGVISALVVQDPYRMGYDGIKTALAVSKGETVEKNVDTGANLITTANMEEPRSQELLNPKVN
ncbi:ABC transporter substrate-binding protein [Aureimonas sp. SA4125]|uniref:ABC transporter substrate-binding protein n=1 Tax=Aureimonas sp. SA4125 TaxID=2826993 RepID=UPI001CC7E934|nr:ABC transporter substrate-binding protein [Aureimonas sp. SA4125]BDA83133.1 ABC transporter substrate-binding protein [Aureimonas sp. SA4125]